jgi:hypothetical protein
MTRLGTHRPATTFSKRRFSPLSPLHGGRLNFATPAPASHAPFPPIGNGCAHDYARFRTRRPASRRSRAYSRNRSNFSNREFQVLAQQRPVHVLHVSLDHRVRPVRRNQFCGRLGSPWRHLRIVSHVSTPPNRTSSSYPIGPQRHAMTRNDPQAAAMTHRGTQRPPMTSPTGRFSPLSPLRGGGLWTGFAALASASRAPFTLFIDGAASRTRTTRFSRVRDLAVTLVPRFRRSCRAAGGQAAESRFPRHAPFCHTGPATREPSLAFSPDFFLKWRRVIHLDTQSARAGLQEQFRLRVGPGDRPGDT